MSTRRITQLLNKAEPDRRTAYPSDYDRIVSLLDELERMRRSHRRFLIYTIALTSAWVLICAAVIYNG